MNYYGYNHTQRNSSDLGAIIHDVMNAAKYAEENDLILVFVEEGYKIPQLDDNWHSYFTSFEIVKSDECIEIWPNFIPDTKYTKWNIQQYSNLIQKFCIFQKDIQISITELINKIQYNSNTDIVVYVQDTNLTSNSPTNIPVEKYIEECDYALSQMQNEQNRIYVCTEHKNIANDIKNYFDKKGIDVVHDDYQPNEMMKNLQNLFIMKNAKYLIGGRISYLFRVAELLRYPNKSVNIQDNNIFGIAPYSSVDYMIRPYLKNTISNFVNKDIITLPNITKYNKIYNDENIVTIPDFISHEILSSIKTDIENYKWWSYATIPTNNKWTVKYSQGISSQTIIECDKAYVNKLFSYRFQRCLGKHYDSCKCVSCKLNDTVKSFPFTDILCKIVGCRNLKPKEVFLSNYGKNDFLTLHHDINKGDIAVTISLTYDWDPNYGGILHFCDDEKNIYKSVVPKLGNINIFKLDPDNGIDHFVSRVTVDKNRYTLVAWYSYTD